LQGGVAPRVRICVRMLKSPVADAICVAGTARAWGCGHVTIVCGDIVRQPGPGKKAGPRYPWDFADHMTQLSEIYNQRILELAAHIAGAQRLADAEASATAHSKLCGSTVTVDLKVEGDRVAAFGQTVKACLLGQAAASVMGRNIIGTGADELREVARTMRAMLKAGGPPPTGRWADLAVLQPVKDYKARHASTLLVFDAVEMALAKVEAKRAEPAPVEASA
jgi:NifU-like protein involved in Fe-S cluster formation